MSIHKKYRALIEGDRIPRKDKKALLGNRLSKTKLKLLLRQVKVLETYKTMYELPKIHPYIFCPSCGCKESYGTGNMTEYPEHFECFKCLRCHYVVGCIDNSPFYHVLQFSPEFKLPF